MTLIQYISSENPTVLITQEVGTDSKFQLNKENLPLSLLISTIQYGAMRPDLWRKYFDISIKSWKTNNVYNPQTYKWVKNDQVTWEGEIVSCTETGFNDIVEAFREPEDTDATYVVKQKNAAEFQRKLNIINLCIRLPEVDANNLEYWTGHLLTSAYLEIKIGPCTVAKYAGCDTSYVPNSEDLVQLNVKEYQVAFSNYDTPFSTQDNPHNWWFIQPSSTRHTYFGLQRTLVENSRSKNLLEMQSSQSVFTIHNSIEQIYPLTDNTWVQLKFKPTNLTTKYQRNYMTFFECVDIIGGYLVAVSVLALVMYNSCHRHAMKKRLIKKGVFKED
jgi:hypothetical protein